ncbi:hypothetical protein DFJ74DRAFT_775144 [Hyaloraphidium curvatum]|nr:hypothetical protein DFJ74DRAFT_775144 [Hyaloraphidium curvatum]
MAVASKGAAPGDAPPEDFSDAEWLALFPAPGKVPEALSGQPAPPDRAAELRELRPLSAKSMASILRAKSAPLALLFRLHRVATPWGRYLFEMMAMLSLLSVATWVVFWLLETWRTWWAAMVVVLLVTLLISLVFIMQLGRFSTNVALLELSQRMQHRAVRPALSSLLNHLRRAALEGPVADGGAHSEPCASETAKDGAIAPGSPPGQLYIELHQHLAVAWRFRISNTNFSSPLFVTAGIAILCAVANIIAGNCIPWMFLFAVGYYALLLSIDLVNFAAANSSVQCVRDLYTQARLEIRCILANPLLTDPHGPRAAAASELRAHDAVLGSLREMDAYRARLLGFVITYGVLRMAFVTVCTVLLGVWSTLRAQGTYVTLEMSCR